MCATRWNPCAARARYTPSSAISFCLQMDAALLASNAAIIPNRGRGRIFLSSNDEVAASKRIRARLTAAEYEPPSPRL